MALNLTPQDIVPAAPSDQTAAAVPPASEPASDSATLPEEVLAIPAMHGLLNGAPPAIYSPNVRRNDPDLTIIAKNADPLVNAGFGFYKSKDGKYSVLFNTAYISENQLKRADAAGHLTQVAAPFDQVRSSYDAAIAGPGAAPTTAPIATDAAPAPVPSAVAAPQPLTPPISSGTQQKITTARLKNLSLGSPTSGPAPGAGRVLNNILKSTV
jgi:hypothetical protein